MINSKSLKLKMLYFFISFFIIKNIFSFTVNYFEIKRLQDELHSYKEENLQLVDDIKNIKTDGFVVRYGVDNLNLRPREEDLIDLTITNEELIEFEIRLAANKFGKKFENIPIDEIEIPNEIKESILERNKDKNKENEEEVVIEITTNKETSQENNTSIIE